MWIFCGGMRRSGSTLQFQITAHLVEKAGRGRRLEWTTTEDFEVLRERYRNDPGWRVFKNHSCSRAMAEELQQDHARGVYSYRDPRDVLVSSMAKWSATFDELWAGGFADDLLRRHYRWTSFAAVLVSRYEDMMRDLPGEVERIACHLDLEVSAEECARIADEHSLERQRKRIAAAQEQGELQSGFVNDSFDPHSMLHTNHIQSGRSGQWQEALSTQQIALVERRFAGWLEQHGYAASQSRFRQHWAWLCYHLRPSTAWRALRQGPERLRGARRRRRAGVRS